MSDWYYLLENEQKGPLSESELKGNFASSKLSADTLVWKDGMDNWAKAGEVSAFSVQAVTRSPASPPPFVAPQIVCAGCKSPEIIPGYSTPLCHSCRDTMVKAPVPMWLRITMGAIGMLMIVSALHLPKELRAGIAFDRGETADAKGNFQESERHYLDALSIYPDSCNILANLALAADAADDKATLGKCMDTLVEKAKTSDDAKIALNKVGMHWMNEGRQK